MPQSRRNKYFEVTTNIWGKIFHTDFYCCNLDYKYSNRIFVKSNITLIGPFDEASQPGIIMSKKSQTEIGWKEVVLATRQAKTVTTHCYIICGTVGKHCQLGNRVDCFDESYIVRGNFYQQLIQCGRCHHHQQQHQQHEEERKNRSKKKLGYGGITKLPGP